MARRLPVYILIDTSGSMRGEPIESVKVGLTDMVATLRQEPYALETVCISVITFDVEVKQLIELTELELLQIPEIKTPESGPTHLGLALQKLCDWVKHEIHRTTAESKGDYRPLLFILTDGKPSDIQLYNQMISHVHNLNFALIVACAAGPKAETEPLRKLTENVYRIETIDSTKFRSFFQWVSSVINIGGMSVGKTDDLMLPDSPQEIDLQM